ncbi:MAG: histidine phosphatase family protein [Desulfoplanes sp.]|jgi:probable phosphoglycerate mutase|nr:histidine phosphatase family protein [Desulfoplanes sp.]MDD4650003.1 histidine phosphatase family protein [Desulfoplanes sp.]
MDVYLLRHGDCRTDGVRRYVGQIDYPLNAIGREQARRWQGFFLRHRPDRVVCSDLLRTVQTAEEVLGLSMVVPVLEPAFREISLGDWEGVPHKDIKRDFPDAYAARGADLAAFCPPGGESFAEVQSRVVAAFDALRSGASPTDILLIVTHAGVIRSLLCHILGIPLGQMFSLGLDYAGLTHLEFSRHGWVVRVMNICLPHGG